VRSRARVCVRACVCNACVYKTYILCKHTDCQKKLHWHYVNM